MEIKVYLVERHTMIREGLKALLHEEPSIRVVAESDSTARLPSLADCDVILIEYSGSTDVLLEQLQDIKDAHPAIKVIVLTGHDDTLEVLQSMFEAGVSGYLTKDASKEELQHSIRKVCDDGNYVCTAFVMRLLKQKHFIKPKTLLLRDTEQDLLNLIAEGLTNNDIAQQLRVSVRTIETRRKKILEKTGTVNTAALIRFAAENGLLK